MLKKAALFSNIIKNAAALNLQQTRNTFILKRRFPPGLVKKQYSSPKFKTRNFIYDLVKYTEIEPLPEIKIILTQDVKGLGYKSDLVEMKPNKAYIDYLLPGLAVYDTPENRSKYNCTGIITEKKTLTAERTIDHLSVFKLYIPMNKSQPWTLEPWHISTAFREKLVHVPENTIKMPPGEISGPDLSLEDKEFYVTVTVNGKLNVNVRCRIYHWENGVENLTSIPEYWNKHHEPLFEEQAEVLSQM